TRNGGPRTWPTRHVSAAAARIVAGGSSVTAADAAAERAGCDVTVAALVWASAAARGRGAAVRDDRRSKSPSAHSIVRHRHSPAPALPWSTRRSSRCEVGTRGAILRNTALSNEFLARPTPDAR